MIYTLFFWILTLFTFNLQANIIVGNLNDPNSIYTNMPNKTNAIIDLTVCVDENMVDNWQTSLSEMINNIPSDINIHLRLALPNSITTIESCFLHNCLNIITITLPDSIEYIGDYFLYNCPKIDSFTLPISLKKIGTNFMGACPKLTTLTIQNCDQLIINDPNFLSGCINVDINLYISTNYPYAFCTPESIEKLDNDTKINLITLRDNSHIHNHFKQRPAALFFNGQPITPQKLYYNHSCFINITVAPGCHLNIIMPKRPKRPNSSLKLKSNT